MTRICNPLKEDSDLRILLGKLDDVQTSDEFSGWRTSFLSKFVNFLDIEGTDKAEDAYWKFSDSLSAFVTILNKLTGFIEREEITNDNCTVRARQCLGDFHRQLTTVIEQVEGLVPGTMEDEKQCGYSKFHIGAVLVRDGFKEYGRLSLMGDVLEHLEETLADVADRLILQEMKRYVVKLNGFCDIMADLGLFGAMSKCRELVRADEDEEPIRVIEVVEDADENVAEIDESEPSAEEDDQDPSADLLGTEEMVPPTEGPLKSDDGSNVGQLVPYENKKEKLELALVTCREAGQESILDREPQPYSYVYKKSEESSNRQEPNLDRESQPYSHVYKRSVESSNPASEKKRKADTTITNKPEQAVEPGSVPEPAVDPYKPDQRLKWRAKDYYHGDLNSWRIAKPRKKKSFETTTDGEKGKKLSKNKTTEESKGNKNKKLTKKTPRPESVKMNGPTAEISPAKAREPENSKATRGPQATNTKQKTAEPPPAVKNERTPVRVNHSSNAVKPTDRKKSEEEAKPFVSKAIDSPSEEGADRNTSVGGSSEGKSISPRNTSNDRRIPPKRKFSLRDFFCTGSNSWRIAKSKPKAGTDANGTENKEKEQDQKEESAKAENALSELPPKENEKGKTPNDRRWDDKKDAETKHIKRNETSTKTDNALSSPRQKTNEKSTTPNEGLDTQDKEKDRKQNKEEGSKRAENAPSEPTQKRKENSKTPNQEGSDTNTTEKRQKKRNEKVGTTKTEKALSREKSKLTKKGNEGKLSDELSTPGLLQAVMLPREVKNSSSAASKTMRPGTVSGLSFCHDEPALVKPNSPTCSEALCPDTVRGQSFAGDLPRGVEEPRSATGKPMRPRTVRGLSFDNEDPSPVKLNSSSGSKTLPRDVEVSGSAASKSMRPTIVRGLSFDDEEPAPVKPNCSTGSETLPRNVEESGSDASKPTRPSMIRGLSFDDNEPASVTPKRSIVTKTLLRPGTVCEPSLVGDLPRDEDKPSSAALKPTRPSMIRGLSFDDNEPVSVNPKLSNVNDAEDKVSRGKIDHQVASDAVTPPASPSATPAPTSRQVPNVSSDNKKETQSPHPDIKYHKIICGGTKLLSSPRKANGQFVAGKPLIIDLPDPASPRKANRKPGILGVSDIGKVSPLVRQNAEDKVPANKTAMVLSTLGATVSDGNSLVAKQQEIEKMKERKLDLDGAEPPKYDPVSAVSCPPSREAKSSDSENGTVKKGKPKKSAQPAEGVSTPRKDIIDDCKTDPEPTEKNLWSVEAKADPSAKGEESKEDQVQSAKDDMEVVKAKQRKCYMWYARMGQPTRTNMKKRVAALSDSCDITVDDVDRLPWICNGTVLSVAEMNKLFLQDDAHQ